MIRARAGWPILLLLVICGSGCDWDFERMIDQPNLRQYEATDYFSDGTTMQTAPRGTVAWTAGTVPPLRPNIASDGGFVETVPVDLDRSTLERGRQRFGLFCATCHGERADGNSAVAQAMTLRRPPSLLSERVIHRSSPGRLYAVVSHGYGLMPSYGRALTRHDRWAVVAFVKALQLSRGIRLDELSPRHLAEARRWLQ